MDTYKLQSYHFELPEDLIAQSPVYPRDHSRLMVIDRKNGNISEMPFFELQEMLKPHDQLIFNNTKVIPARLTGYKETGARIEVFLSKEKEEGVWEVLIRPAKKVPIGSRIVFNDSLWGEILENYSQGLMLIKFYSKKSFKEELLAAGQIPLPHYIKRNGSLAVDQLDYQTLFAKKEGAVAAPTAGLHFTQQLLDSFTQKNVDLVELTLHVGLGTFKPVQCEDIRDHKMHTETVEVPEHTSILLNNSKNNLQIAVGTTSCRALESSADLGVLKSGKFETNLFIYPGYQFKFVKALLTNFHLPGSSLLMLVSAFGGYELIMEAYQKAIEKKFRFYSYGDAMLIL